MLISRNWNSGKRTSSYIQATIGVISTSWRYPGTKKEPEKELVFRITSGEQNDFQILKLRLDEKEARELIEKLLSSLDTSLHV